MFAVSNASGDMPIGNEYGFGLYHLDTRFLSGFQLTINGSAPILLSSSVDRAYVATFQLVNPALSIGEHQDIPRQTISLRRTRFVHRGLHERIGVQNCNRFPVELKLELDFAADFRDIFAVRGYHSRDPLGEAEPVETGDLGFRFRYDGKDGVDRATEVIFSSQHVNHSYRDGRAVFPLRLAPHETFVVQVDILPLLDGEQPPLSFDFDSALAKLEKSYQEWNQSCTQINCDNEILDGGLLWRSREDIRILCDDFPSGLFPTAGIPWYAVPFGRDGLITSIQALGLNPDLARGTLRYLARWQGKVVDPSREEEPGKIFHEIRFGELANLHLIPHTPYYGSVDSTPLFLCLLVDLVDWTGDLDLLTELTPNLVAALRWCDTFGDLDGDGFVDVAAGGYTLATPTAWSVFVYRGGPTGIAAAPSYTMVSPDGTPFSDPAGLGDVDGDGFSDLGIAASDDPRAGHAYVVRGAASGPSTAAAWTLTPDPGSLAGFGAIVTRVGDLDADGFADFVESTCCSQGQAAQLYRGGASGPVRVAGTFPVGAGRGTGSGDVNGDGYADMTMSNSFAASGQAQVYGFFGGKTLGAVVAWQVVAPGAATIYQGGTAHADFDGDGIVDLLVTLPGYDGLPDGGTGGVVGRAHVFLGKAGGTGYADADLKATLEAATPADAVLGGGWLTGDMDGDGRDDIALGTRFRNAVAVYRGIPQNTTAAFLTGDADGLGMSLAH